MNCTLKGTQQKWILFVTFGKYKATTQSFYKASNITFLQLNTTCILQLLVRLHDIHEWKHCVCCSGCKKIARKVMHTQYFHAHFSSIKTHNQKKIVSFANLWLCHNGYAIASMEWWMLAKAVSMITWTICIDAHLLWHHKLQAKKQEKIFQCSKHTPLI